MLQVKMIKDKEIKDKKMRNKLSDPCENLCDPCGKKRYRKEHKD